MDERDNHLNYSELREYLRVKSVVNDPATPIMKNFKEDHLQMT